MNPDVTFWDIMFASSLRDAKRWAADLIDWLDRSSRPIKLYNIST